MPRIIYILILLALSLQSNILLATHNRAGEITYRHIGGYTYEVTVLTYTFTPSLANRDSLKVNWGDGSPASTVLIDKKIALPNNVRYNTYVGTHTYPGPGTYIISMEDPNRNGGVVNIPNSVNVPFYIESQLVINPFIGPNSSPSLLAPPIDNACVGFPFMHNPTASDIDGDSLSYSLIPCKGENGHNIGNYTLPIASKQISIDPVTGDLLWDAPTLAGEFNVAILIEEWRNGVRIGYVIRDMQIYVTFCSNYPPVLENIVDTCVVVGDTLVLTVKATDPDNDVVTISAAGGPLGLSQGAAVFPEVTKAGVAVGDFIWIPKCNAARKQPHLVTFKAKDNGLPVNLFDLKSVFITVIAPAPETLQVSSVGNNMVINWSVSPCKQANGYSLYRKIGYSNFNPSHCETGVPEWTGYTKIASLSGLHNTTYIDDNGGVGLIHGINYCYRVVADFPDKAQSKASHEVCNSLKQDVPIITHVDIVRTSESQGMISVDWVPPNEIDTAIAKGPYKYLIYRSDGNGQNFKIIDSLSDLNDTIYLDQLLNTTKLMYFYRIALLNDEPGNRFVIGHSYPASSVFLRITPEDKMLTLSWKPTTPWENYTYIIYRQNPVTLQFDSIASTEKLVYNDSMLKNGVTYCYYLKSIGTYGNPAIISPLVNNSQQKCDHPIDNVGPCPPNFIVTTNCIENTVLWGRPDSSCGDDIHKYEVWYAPSADAEFKMVYLALSPDDTLYVHSQLPSSIVGCYKIRGIDSTGNIGPFSEVICMDIDGCVVYKIPNVFTPNDDGSNDILKPFPYSSVERINLSIVNRWGAEVYRTDDPDILWDGKNQSTGVPVPSGVYYYVAEVWFRSLKGERSLAIHGVVHVLY